MAYSRSLTGAGHPSRRVRTSCVRAADAADPRVTKHKQKQTPWPLVRERTIPTDRPPLIDEI
jgi:hypothetical protein